MNDLSTRTAQLPDNIRDLAKFALIGREKLASVRAEIRAITKVGLAKDVLEQKRNEAQEIAELVTLSEVRIGTMLKEIPKASHQGNQYTGRVETSRNGEATKTATIAELGFNRNQVSEFQRMADNEDIVLEAITEAKENNDIISRSAVLKKIDEAKKPHVFFNSGNNEWYTPPEIIEAVRLAMGSIDLDPASNDIAQKTVKAKTYYTIESNGLDKTWTGNIFMNPPYGADVIGAFISKLVRERDNYEQAIVLVNNATETEWFNNLVSIASAVCFPKGRIRYYTPEGKQNTPLQGQALIYIGEEWEAFITAFSDIGWGAVMVGV